jgi:subtilisin family serine protease
MFTHSGAGLGSGHSRPKVRWPRLGSWLLGGAALFIGCAGDGPAPDAPDQRQEALNPGVSVPPPPAPSPGSKSKERTVWVVMKQRPALAVTTSQGWSARGKAVYDTLTRNASASQSSLKAWLTQRSVVHKGFWGVNTVKVTADDGTIALIAQRADVAKVIEDGKAKLPIPDPVVVNQAILEAEWNIEEVRAPEAWSQFGARGDGVVVGSIDTGVQFDHPALLRQYRGAQTDGTVVHDYNWYDPSSVCGFPSLTPCDNAGHGTHTMGTIVGDDGGDNQIGVAPDARWMAAKGCEDFSCSFDALISAGQWMLAPTDLSGQNPRPDLRPNLVSNSWGGGGGDFFYQEIVSAWVASGIFPVFSNGNSGPFCSSSGSPGDYPESYSSGAYDQAGIIADFSSRGPSAFGIAKPNIAAPGVDVRSAFPGNSYAFLSGTSMAAPHVAGAVALLWSAAPSLIGDVTATRELLDSGAVDTNDTSCGGTPENNNTWGQGKLDVVSSLELAPIGPTGFLAGTVTNDASLAIPGARIVTTGPASRTRVTDQQGFYQLRLPVGSYSVATSAFGYLSESVAGVEVTEGATTTVDVALDAAPAFSLDGTVTDASGAPIVGAEVNLVGTPLSARLTDASGHFDFGSVPQGVYTVSTDAGGCYATGAQELNLQAPASLGISLPNVTDAYGYQCRPRPFDYLSGTTPIAQFDDTVVSVNLPFPFTFYGATHDKLLVDMNGLVAFDAPFSNPFNVPLPSPDVPNSAIYGLWDDLFVFEPSHVLTGVFGSAPNRQFVIEWRDVPFAENADERANFEIVLHETGQITVSYLNGSSPRERGGSATVGIENGTGDVALQYSFNRPLLKPELSLTYEVPFSGFAQGSIKDVNDGAPIGGAKVTATSAEGLTRSAATNAAGLYRLQLTEGNYQLTVTKTNYQPQTFNVTVVEGETSVRDASLLTPRAVLTPPTIQLVMPANTTRTRKLNLANTGSLPLDFTLAEAGGRKQVSKITAKLAKAAKAISPNARDTRGLFAPQALAAAVTPSTPGDVLFSFAPTGLGLGWGVGLGQNLWVSDVVARKNFEFLTSGAQTGRSWATPWSGDWPADMAYDTVRNAMCQLAVGGDNAIHCWDQASGDAVYQVTGAPWSNTSQRGLAYSPATDSFFVGGWNEGIIYHVQGLSGASPGAVLSSCPLADGNVSGLAYNSAMDVLWVATNSDTDTIYQVNPYDCTVLSTLAPPQGGSFQGAGLELDAEGNLWAIAQSPNRVFLVESGVPAFSDVTWLKETPIEGVVPVARSKSITVTIDTAGLTPGLYLGTLFVLTNAGRESTLRVPVSLIVSGYVQGVNAGGDKYVDSLGDTWAKSKAHATGAWGYIQKGTTRTTKKAIAGASEPVLYQSQHEDPYAYRFDNVPNGVYEVDLRSAELQNVRPGQRLFDVIVENTLVLPAYDIVYEADSTFTADDQRFFVEVTDNRMDVRFVPRAGFKKPVINALRVTHRPDR